MPRRDWKLRATDIVTAIRRIDQYVAGLDFDAFTADQKCVDAVVRNLEVIGEATKHLLDSPSLTGGTVPWSDIAAMRNILVHEYFGVDLAIVWHTVTHDLPALREHIVQLLVDHDPGATST